MERRAEKRRKKLLRGERRGFLPKGKLYHLENT